MFSAFNSHVTPQEDLAERERNPPPEPTPLDFPQAVPKPRGNPLTDSRLEDLRQFLLSLRAHKDVRLKHLEALNIQVVRGLTCRDLLPQACHRDHFPPLPSWHYEERRPLLGNGNPSPGPEKYDVIERELRLHNNDAFRELVRLPPAPGRQRIRITQTRKFWGGLERMSQYWDTTLDQYYESSIGREADTKRMKMDDDDSSKGSGANQAAAKGPDAMQLDQPENASSATTIQSPSQSRTRYKGRRIGTGSSMPEECREETIRSFVEMIVWAFGCQVTAPNIPPRLCVDTILFPVRHSNHVIRSPADRTLARKGIMDGPLLAIQCKNETSFRSPDEQPGESHGDAVDLFREVGAMLLLAQERAREARIETLPGQGKWWTTTPRWGGGPGGIMATDSLETIGDESPPPPPPAEPAPSPFPNTNSTLSFRASSYVEATIKGIKAEQRRSRRNPGSSGSSSSSTSTKRTNLADKWKVLKPGSSLWDPRMVYQQIGKVKGDEFDDIYMITSINHHIAILHLRVHPNYLSWLSGDSSQTKNPASTTEKAGNETTRVLKLRRTKWYDLFDVEDRVEAMRGVWGVTAWLMRSDDKEETKT